MVTGDGIARNYMIRMADGCHFPCAIPPACVRLSLCFVNDGFQRGRNLCVSVIGRDDGKDTVMKQNIGFWEVAAKVSGNPAQNGFAADL